MCVKVGLRKVAKRSWLTYVVRSDARFLPVAKTNVEIIMKNKVSMADVGNSGITTSTVTVETLAALFPAKSVTISVTVKVPALE